MKIFKGIANFIATIIDKLIVTPLTKLIVKITGNKNNSGKLFETLLTKPTALLFISLFFAVALFIMVDQKITEELSLWMKILMMI